MHAARRLGDVTRALLHLELGLLVVGDGEHGAGLDTAVADEVAQPSGEHPGLARTGGGDDARRAGVVGDRGQLVGGEVVGRRPRCGDEGARTELDRLGVHQQLAGSRRTSRTAVDPHRSAVGEAHVAGCVVRRRDHDGARGDPARLGRPPPHGLAGAQVVVVGPHQEVEAVEPRLGQRRVRPGLAADRLRRAEAGRVDRQLDDDLPAARPGVVQPGDHPARREQRRLVDPHDRGVGPRLGRRRPRRAAPRRVRVDGEVRRSRPSTVLRRASSRTAIWSLCDPKRRSGRPWPRTWGPGPPRSSAW